MSAAAAAAMNSNMRPAGPPEQILHGFPGAFPPPPQPDRVDISQRRNTISAPIYPSTLPYHDEIKDLNERLKRLGLDQPSPDTVPKGNGTAKNKTHDKDGQAKPESQNGLLQGWTLSRGESSGERNWKTAKNSKMTRSHDELVSFVKKQGKMAALSEYQDLSPLKQQHVDDLIRSVKQEDNDPRFDWTLVYLGTLVREVRGTFKRTKLVMPSIDIVLMKQLKPEHSLNANNTQAAAPTETRQAEETEPRVQPMENPQTVQPPFIHGLMHPVFSHGANPHFVPGPVPQPGNHQREEIIPATHQSKEESRPKDMRRFTPKVHFQEPPHSTANAVPEMLQQNVHQPFMMPAQAQVYTTPSKQHLYETRYHTYSGPPPPQQTPQEQPKPNQPLAQTPLQPQQQRPQVRIHQKPQQTRAAQRQHEQQEQKSQPPPPPPQQHYPTPQVIRPEPTTSKRRSGIYDNGQLERYLEEVTSNESGFLDPEDDSSYFSDDSLFSDAFDDNASELSNVRSHQRRVSRQLQVQRHQQGYRTHGRPGPKYYSSGSSGMSGTQYSIENGEVTPARTIQRPAAKVKRSNTISYETRQKPQLIQAQRPREFLNTAASPEAISAALRNQPTALRDLPGTREWHQKQNVREPLYRHYATQQETQRRKERQAKGQDLPKQMPTRKAMEQSQAPRTMPAPPAAPAPPSLPFTDAFGRPMPDPYKAYDEKAYADAYDTPLVNNSPDDYDDYYRLGQQPMW